MVVPDSSPELVHFPIEQEPKQIKFHESLTDTMKKKVPVQLKMVLQ